MKKLFYICLVTFFVTGASLFYLIDKNYDTIKMKFNEKFYNGNNEDGFVVLENNEEIQTIEKEYNSNFKKILIDVNVGEIKIESYDGLKIKVKCKIPKKSFGNYKVNENGENLEIYASVADEMLIQVPKNIFLSGDIKLGIGDLTVENLKDLKIQLGTGNLSGKNLENIEKISLNLGDLNLKNIKNIDKITLGTGQGDIELVEQNRDFSIENHLGDLSLKITNNFQGNIDSKVNLGDSNSRNLNLVGQKYKGQITVDIGELSITGM